MQKRRYVSTNGRGGRVGQDHPKAVLTDREVQQLLALREEGWGYSRLAAVFEVSRSQVRNICTGRQRALLGVHMLAKKSG